MPSYTMFRFQDSLYIHFEGAARTWAEAEALAPTISLDARWKLASITSAEEAGYMNVVLAGGDTSWIGLSQSPDATGPADGWTWADGTPYDFTQWAPGEPNDFYGPGSENVAEIYVNGNWNDATESLTHTQAIFEASALTSFRLHGLTGGDLMRGGEGDDTLNGMKGDDTLVGGAGIDVLTGGMGVDTFRFEAISDSAMGALDRIRNFQAADDILDFTALTVLAHFSDDGRFDHAVGEVITRVQTSASGSRTLVLIDVDGDGLADAGARILGNHLVTADNILTLI